MVGVEPTPQSGIRNVIAVVCDKGGVGKTSTTANVAGQMAAGGLRVLVVDVDKSGSLAIPLGMTGQGDDGRSIVDALAGRRHDFEVVEDVRPNLDWIPGGTELAILMDLYYRDASLQQRGGMAVVFAQILAPIAARYDLVLIDTPPSNLELQEVALYAAAFAVTPTNPGPQGLEGLRRTAPIIRQLQRHRNPRLEWLGAIISKQPVRASRLIRVTRQILGGATIPVFDSTIRLVPALAEQMETRGVLSHELADQAEQERVGLLDSFRSKKDNPTSTGPAWPALDRRTGGQLASDYAALTREICERVSARQAAMLTAAGGVR